MYIYIYIYICTYTQYYIHIKVHTQELAMLLGDHNAAPVDPRSDLGRTGTRKGTNGVSTNHNGNDNDDNHQGVHFVTICQNPLLLRRPHYNC